MKVLLIDDHPMVNSGLASYLEETGRFTVCGQVNTLAQAKSFFEDAIQTKKDIPSLIILDIMLGEENGLDFLNYLEEYCQVNQLSKPHVLVCSALEEPFCIQNALKLGASGFITKSGSKEELINAIDSIQRGNIHISEEHSVKLVKSYDLYTKFTKREMEIFNLIKRNKSNKQIASELKLNIRTVENHVSNIYFKTGTSNRQELMER